jgi:hypothetical protein
MHGRNVYRILDKKCGGRDYRRNFKIYERIINTMIHFGGFGSEGGVLDVAQLRTNINTVTGLRVLHKQGIAAE